MNNVSLSLIEKFRDQTENSAFDRAMMNALTKHNVKDVAFTNRGLEEAQFAFSVNVPTMEVTNQKQSGQEPDEALQPHFPDQNQGRF